MLHYRESQYNVEMKEAPIYRGLDKVLGAWPLLGAN